MKYDTYAHCGIYSTTNKERLSFVATWMNTEGILPREISQTQWNSPCMTSCPCGIWKSCTCRSRVGCYDIWWGWGCEDVGQSVTTFRYRVSKKFWSPDSYSPLQTWNLFRVNHKFFHTEKKGVRGSKNSQFMITMSQWTIKPWFKSTICFGNMLVTQSICAAKEISPQEIMKTQIICCTTQKYSHKKGYNTLYLDSWTQSYPWFWSQTDLNKISP